MRTKKAFKNIVWSATYQIVAIICGLITPRLLLVAFGSTYNGVVQSATQFLSAISFLTLGIAGATRMALYKTLAANDVVGTSRVMKANRLYMRKVGICVLLYALILSIIYPFISHNDLSHIENGALILIVSIGTFADYFFGISNTTLLSADQSGYIGSISSIIKTILNTIITALLIKIGCSIFTVKLGSSIVFLICPFILEIIIKRKYKLITNIEPDHNALSARKAVAFHSVANIIHDDTDILVLTFFTDAKVISVYTVYNLAVGKLKNIVSIFTNGMEGAFGNMWVKGEIQALRKNFEVFEFFMYAFTSVVFSCVWVLLIPFVSVYTRGVNDTNYILPLLSILFTVTEALRCVRTPYLILVQATGNYEDTKNGAMAEAIINLSVSVILVKFIGIYGVVIGTLIANLFRTTQYAVYISKHVIDRDFCDVIKKALWLAATMSIIIVLSTFILNSMPISNGWVNWIIQAIYIFSIATLVTLGSAMICYRQNMLYLLNKLRSMLVRKS